MNNAFGTQQAITSELPALLAGQILAAMRHGSLEELETGLDRAESLAANHPKTVVRAAEPYRGMRDNQVEEQLELLGAVAGDLRHSISRYGRQLTPHLEGIEVHLQLLRHLAKPVATC
jgi:hypothetical protein